MMPQDRIRIFLVPGFGPHPNKLLTKKWLLAKFLPRWQVAQTVRLDTRQDLPRCPSSVDEEALCEACRENLEKNACALKIWVQ